MYHDLMDQTMVAVPEERILDDNFSHGKHKLGGNFIEETVEACPHPKSTSQVTPDRVQFKSSGQGPGGQEQWREGSGRLHD